MHTFTSFKESPKSWEPRKWFFWVHLYAGLVVGLLALAIGLSGAALVYSPELELAPRWAPGAAAHPMPLDDLARTVRQRYPEFQLQDIRFNAQGDATVVHLRKPDQSAQKGAAKANTAKQPGTDLHMVINPETAAVFKIADRNAGVWNLLRELHHNLLAAKTGRIVNGIGALALLALCVTGMVIWWPGPRLWKQRTKIKEGSNWKRLNWDLHTASGFWLAAGLAFFAFTGFQHAFPDAAKRTMRSLTNSRERAKKPRLEGSTGSTASLAVVVANARAAVPDGRIAQIKLPTKAAEPFEVRVKTAFDGHHEGNNKVFLDRVTGEVILVDRFDRLSFANRAIELLAPLHSARFMTLTQGSVLARLPWIVMGLAPGFLFITGLLIWWNRVVSKKWAALQRPKRAKHARQWTRVAGLASAVVFATLRLSAEEGMLAGRVVDPSGTAVSGAKVVLRTSPERLLRSRADGGFEFVNIPPGGFPATVEAAGFAIWNGMLRAGALQEVRLELAAEITTITVNAGTLEQERLEDPLISTGIGRADIASRNNRRLSDVVARMPGIFLTGPPGGEKDVRVRGLDKEYSRTQVDGVVIPDGGEKRELQLNRIPSSVVQTVRVIRNPTAEFESDGLAGRVDVQTRPIPEGLRLDGRLGYGARNTWNNGLTQGQLSAGSRLSRRFGFSGSYDFINDHLPIDRTKLLANRNAESEDERQHQQSSNFFGDLGVYTNQFGDLHLKPLALGFMTNMEKLKSTTNPAGTLLSRATEEEDKAQQTRGIAVAHQFARAWGLVWDTQAGFYRSWEDKDKTAQAFKVASGSYTLDKQTPEIETKADRTWNVSSAAALPFQLGVWNELKVGTAFRLRDRFRDKTKFDIDLAGNKKDTSTPKDRYNLAEDYQAFFVQDRLRFTDRLSVMPGVRVERVALNAGNPLSSAAPRVFVDVNPSAHMLYRVRANLTAHAAVSRGLARPKFDELSPFETVASTKITIGNPDLNPTRAWSYDIGADYATSRMSFSANAFRKTIRGVIEEVDTLLNRGTIDIYQVQNAGNGWLRGLEFEQRLRMPSTAPFWARALSVWSNQTFLRSRLLANNGFYRPFKEQPNWITNVGLDFNNDERSGTSVSIISNFTARRFDYKTSGDLTGKSGSTNFDMAVYQRVRGNWRVFAELNNLTNRNRTEDEMFVNGTVNRRAERYGRTALFGLAFGF